MVESQKGPRQPYEVTLVQWCSLSLSLSVTPERAELLLRLLLYLEYKEAQVDVLGGQQLITFHGVYDGERHVVCLVVLVGEDKVIDHGVDFHVVVRTLEQ